MNYDEKTIWVTFGHGPVSAEHADYVDERPGASSM
jgi:hypothetical protein